MQCKEQEVGGFDPFIHVPNSSITQCIMLQPWSKLLGQKHNSLSRRCIFSLPAPAQCSVGVIHSSFVSTKSMQLAGEGNS